MRRHRCRKNKGDPVSVTPTLEDKNEICERSETPKLFFVQFKPMRFAFLQKSVERVCKDCEVLDESAIHVAEAEERVEVRSRLRWFHVSQLRGIGSVDFQTAWFDHVA